tara:strand:+ start:717 stop:1613 length:897 start_codon:yes stop_codon:yes gene_type:complete
MKILIGVCLSKKNFKFLNKFLNSLIKLEVPINHPLKIVFIVEKKNHIFENYISKILKGKKIDFKILFTNRNGIPQLRNIFLEYQKKNVSKYSGFLDDDCIVPIKWLKNMVKFIEKNNCDIVGGPQLHMTKNKFYEKLFKIIEPKNTHGKKVDWVATNNVIFKSKILKRMDLVFDINLKNIGGSDQLFFKKLHLKNLDLKWNLNSFVIENVQIERENLKWFLKRNLRYGYSGNYIDKNIYGSQVGSFLNFSKGCYLFFLSIFFMIIFFLNDNFYRSIFYFCRSIGRFSSLIGYKPNKYI